MNIQTHIKGIICAIFALPAFAGAAEAPADYYTDCENTGGKDLLTALYNTINRHTDVGYSGLWELYKTSDIDENGKIWDTYSTKRWVPGTEQCGNYSLVGDCYNREHTMPKSWWGGAESNQGSDGFVVWPTDGKVNGQRGNFPYGECAKGTTLSSNGDVDALGKLGDCTFDGYSGTVFEPDDQYKGDFARTYFYIAVCYNNNVASWTKSGAATAFMAGNNYPVYKEWAVNLLLKWHRQDPVSDKERNRQEAIFAEQGNRNPFIDHPEMAEHIWGDKLNEKWHSGATPEPAFATPVNGTHIDLGNAAIGIEKSILVTVRASNLTEDASLSVSGAGFYVSPATIPAADANSSHGAIATVQFKVSEPGEYTGVLSIISGTAKTEVILNANALYGLVATDPTNVTSDSFVARWIDCGGADSDGNYTLYVLDSEGMLPGFPVPVRAADEKYRVDGLQPSTEYTYSLQTASQQSNVVTVTTTALLPSIEFYFDGDLHFVTRPGVPSDEAELLVEIENITSDVNISVNPPFQLSTDKHEWATECALSPEEDRIYMRLMSDAEGDFITSITAAAGNYINDSAEATGHVSEDSGIEEFGVGVDYHDWDAYARAGQLVLETTRPVLVVIYGADGLTYHAGEIASGHTAFSLPAGLYIVAVDDFTRRVLVK